MIFPVACLQAVHTLNQDGVGIIGPDEGLAARWFQPSMKSRWRLCSFQTELEVPRWTRVKNCEPQSFGLLTRICLAGSSYERLTSILEENT